MEIDARMQLMSIERRIQIIEAKLGDITLGQTGSGQFVSAEHQLNVIAEGTPTPPWDYHKLRVDGSLSWSCNIFHNCATDFGGKVWMVDERTGDIPTWNLIETTCMNGDIPGFDPGAGKWLHTAKNATECRFGWGSGRDGKHDKVTVWARFYGPFGYITWRIYYQT